MTTVVSPTSTPWLLSSNQPLAATGNARVGIYDYLLKYKYAFYDAKIDKQ